MAEEISDVSNRSDDAHLMGSPKKMDDILTDPSQLSQNSEKHNFNCSENGIEMPTKLVCLTINVDCELHKNMSNLLTDSEIVASDKVTGDKVSSSVDCCGFDNPEIKDKIIVLNNNCLSDSFLAEDSVVEFSHADLNNVHDFSCNDECDASLSSAVCNGDSTSSGAVLPSSGNTKINLTLEKLNDVGLLEPEENCSLCSDKFGEKELENELECLRLENAKLQNEVDRLQADRSAEVYVAQLQSLEIELVKKQDETSSLQAKLEANEEKFLEENIRVKTDLLGRLERMAKQLEMSNKEREAMVMKYATGEKEVMSIRKQKEGIEKKLKDAEKDRETLQGKIKMLQGERARICQSMDAKVHDANQQLKENERLKEELKSLEVKLKWTQTKLKTEADLHVETQNRLEQSLSKITRHEGETKGVKEESEKMLKEGRESEHSRANVLENQLKEEKARLILEKQKNEERNQLYNKVSQELESLKGKYGSLLEEVVTLRPKVSKYESERDESEKLFGSLRNQLAEARTENSSLSAEVRKAAEGELQAAKYRDQCSILQKELADLQSLHRDTQSDLTICRGKEAELLSFTLTLTESNAKTQGQLALLKTQVEAMEEENAQMKSQLESVETQSHELEEELSCEIESLTMQKHSLSEKLNCSKQEITSLQTQLCDRENDIQVLHKKNTNSVKDLTREVNKLRRRLELYETTSVCNSNGGATPHDSISQGSRASSSSSLNEFHQSNHNDEGPSPIQTQEPCSGNEEPMITQQLLLDRIVHLQKALARQAEKTDFLEEHCAQLLKELQKKSRLLQHYILKEEGGALSNAASDSAKVELIKHGGIMASVYGSSPRDEAMTLDLSLEITRKLQAVLEDTLLKNITLKENLNTLGDEISKLSRQRKL